MVDVCLIVLQLPLIGLDVILVVLVLQQPVPDILVLVLVVDLAVLLVQLFVRLRVSDKLSVDYPQLLVIEFHFVVLYSQLSLDRPQISLTCFQLALVKAYPRKYKSPTNTQTKSLYLHTHIIPNTSVSPSA